MDPLASIDRLSTSIAQLAAFIDKFRRDACDAKQDMEDLSEKLASLEESLETLESDFENPQYAERQKKYLKKIIDDCDRITKEMVTLLKSLSSDTGDVPWSGFSSGKMAHLQGSLEANSSAIALVIAMKQLSNSEQDRLNRLANSDYDTESMLSVRQSLLETAPVPYAKKDPYARPGEPRQEISTRAQDLYATPTSRLNDTVSNGHWTDTSNSVHTNTTLITGSPVDLRNASQITKRSDPNRGLHTEHRTSTHSWFEEPFGVSGRTPSTKNPETRPKSNPYRIPDDWTSRQLTVAPIEHSGEGKEVVPSSFSIRSGSTVVSVSEASARSSILPKEGKLDQIAITAAAKARHRLSDPEQRKTDKELLRRVKEGAEISKIESLLDRGADPNAAGPRNTVLTTEIQYSKRQQVIELLLSRGAEPNATSDGIPDHKIIEGGNLDRLRSKIGAGISVDAVPYKVGVLYLAALHTNIEVVELLVSYGAAVRPYSGFLGRMSFSSSHRPSLDGRNSASSQIDYHRSAILVAAENDKWDIVQFLLLHGVNPNETRGKFGSTLQIATAKNKKDLMQLLIDRGADTNTPGGQYGAPLIAAAYEGHPTAAKILLDAGVNINAQSRKLGTALNAAVLNGYLNVVKLLLERGADTMIGYVLDTAVQRLKDDPENVNRKAIVRVLEARGAKHKSFDKGIPEWAGLFSDADDSLETPWAKPGVSIRQKLADVPTSVEWIPEWAGLFSDAGDSLEARARPGVSIWQKLADVPISVEGLTNINILDVSPSLQHGWLVLDWEVPRLISKARPAVNSLPTGSAMTPKDIDIAVVISGAYNLYEVSTTREHLKKYWGDIGVGVLDAIQDALVHMGEVRACLTSGGQCSICAFDARLVLHFDNAFENQHLQNAMIEAMRWFSQSLRPCPDQGSSGLFVSRSSEYRVNAITASALEPLSSWHPDQGGSSGCWTALFANGIVAEQELSRKWGEGLEIPFDLMMQISSVDNYVWLEDKTDGVTTMPVGGYIAIGFFTALIPVERHPVEGMQWHLEFTDDEPMSLADLSAKRISRLPVEDMQELSKCRCFLGWCEKANILLGTAELPNTLSWSGLPQRSESLHASGWNVGAQLGGNIGPMQAIGQVTRTWQLENVRQRFELHTTYAKAIQISSRHVALIYDTATKRAWLVPKLSLMLHLCHTYVRHFEDAGSGNLDPIPYAQPSTDGALAAKLALSGQADIVVFNHGTDHQDQIRLRNVLVDISVNMSRSLAAGAKPRFLRALGPELMDMVTEPGAGALLTEVPTNHFPSSSSASFAQIADSVYVCSNVGSAIRPSAVSDHLACSCMTLEYDRGYLAVHLSCLKSLLQRRNYSLQHVQRSAVPIGDDGRWCPQPYVPCSHLGTVSFWAEPRRFIQCISNTRPRGNVLSSNQIPAITGAVVFGGADSIWNRILEMLRR